MPYLSLTQDFKEEDNEDKQQNHNSNNPVAFKPYPATVFIQLCAKVYFVKLFSSEAISTFHNITD